MKILVVEDEAPTAAFLKRGLTEEGFAVDVARDTAEADEAVKVYEYDVVLLDVMLPGSDGFALCRRWREEGVTAPILFLTARDDVPDRVRGLDAGGDDYLVKPFAFAELLARVRALLRRPHGGSLRPEIEVGDLMVDTSRRHVTRGGKPVPLTTREYQLLEFLARNAGKVVTRTALWEHVWESGAEPDSNVVDVYVRGEIAFADLSHEGTGFRGVYYPIRDAPAPGAVALVAISREPVTRSLRAVTGSLAISLAIAAVGAGWLVSRVARRLTDPLEQIADAARAIGPDGTHAVIPAVSSDVELRALTDILNGMLHRLDTALQAVRAAAAAQRRFVADASHELRTPLTNLRGTIEVALRHPRTAEEYRDTLATAVHEIERLSRLANDLLMLSRADAAQLRCQSSPCDLAAVVSGTVRGWADRAREQRVSLRLEAPSHLPIVADADRSRQVLDNLLDNALRHAPSESEVVVTAGTQNGAATLRVRDRGPGLASEEQARVFERFYRTDASRARHSGGLGLGLAIAKAIVEAHSGTLAVESAPGSGCTFEARLPQPARE